MSGTRAVVRNLDYNSEQNEYGFTMDVSHSLIQNLPLYHSGSTSSIFKTLDSGIFPFL
jgi:hypothetical protein